MRGGWAGYGAGSSFLIDFSLLSHLKPSSYKALDIIIVIYILDSVIIYGAIRPLFVRT